MGVDHAGRAALAQALEAKEAAAGLALHDPTRSRAAAVKAANRCRKPGVDELRTSAVNDWVKTGAAARDFQRLWAYVTVLDQWARERDPSHGVRAA